MEDEEIIQEIRRRGENEAALTELLIKKYIPLVNREIRFLFLAGADADDLTQEGMIGLYSAICSFQQKEGTRFITYAAACVRNRLKDAVKAAGRQKNMPLNNYISLFGGDTGETELALSEILGGPETENPENIYLQKEQERDLQDVMKRLLSPLERRVAENYLNGLSRPDIAEKLGKDEKAVSNALSRIRKKLSGYVKEWQ